MTLRRAQHSAVRLLTFDRPGAKNAIDAALAAQLFEALTDADRDEAVSVVVLASSSPDVFLAGGDLKELAALPSDVSGADRVLAVGVQLAIIERCRVPVIAAVAGRVLGGGCELLMMCDVVVMERHASLRFVHARMGLVPAWGGSSRLLERVGHSAASDLLLSSRAVDGEEAGRLGLAQRVVEDGAAQREALALAAEMAGAGRGALVRVKRALSASRLAQRGDAIDAESKVFRQAWGSAEQQRAFAALAKQKP
jgi:enoyl-CoA hydratase